MDQLRLLFGVSGHVSRQQYLIAGVVLMIVKYALDAAVVYLALGQAFTPLDYINPLLSAREKSLGGNADEVLLVMIAYALPFIWIGVTMTMRRARDAGVSPWVALLFFLPIINWVLMLVLAVLPTRVLEDPVLRDPDDAASGFRAALLGILVSCAIAGVMVPLAVYGMGDYGSSLFLGTPFVQGLVTGHIYNHKRVHSIGGNLAVISAGVWIVAGFVMLIALEGAVCLLMALPLAWVAALMGMFFGRMLAKAAQSPARSATAILLLPVLTIAEPTGATETYEVVSVVEIDAPPQVVWENLVAVSELPPPHEAVFLAGVAYPQRARIEGEGVGAVRNCEFSTGAFVEPITTWDEPARLSFDVIDQPAPMHEWSPYRHVHPPHLDGYFRSVRGEFRLIPTATGTRLEGSTWYELDILPRAYWRLWSDGLIHAIHERVLVHIKTTTEARATCIEAPCP